MAKMARMLLLAGCAAVLSDSLLATTYYIDFGAGSDSSAGTSKSAPWQHAPGMTGCTANCASTTPKPGDSFILKGGVTWPSSALGWDWTWKGSGSTSTPGCTGTGCIYIGVDQTWYAGSAWSRPVLNAGAKAVSTTAAGSNVIFRCYCNYVKIDNIEFTGLYWTGHPSYGSSVNLAIAGGSPGIGVGVEIENIYIHGWSHNSAASGAYEHTCSITGDTATPNNNANTWLHDSVISGADTAQDSCSAVFGGPPIISNNVMEYVSSCMIINGPSTVHDNLCQNVVHSFDSTAHENGLEINASLNVTIYNNVFRHIGSGSLTLWCAPNKGYSCYIFNNVIYDTDINNVLDMAASLVTSPSGSEYLWNNTVECGPDGNPGAVCAAGINSAVAAVTLQNNHFISNATSYWNTGGVVPTLVTNVLQSKAAAIGQGYAAAQAFGFSPTQPYPQSATQGQGTSAAALCATTGVLACLSDTTFAVAYDTSTHSVTFPARTPNQRPSTGAWDVGAYQFLFKPDAPQSLTGVPR